MPVITRRRAAFAVGAGAVVLLSGLLVLPPGAALADTGFASSSFDGYAQGNAIDATASNRSLPLGLVLEGAGPEASAHLASLGQQDAEASFPYLGPVVPGLTGVAAAVLGLPVPAYPLAANTGAGDKPSDVSFPGVTLHAESGIASTVGAATVGNDGAGGATSNARVSVGSDGSVTSAADAAVNALKLGGVLTVSGLHSHAEVVADGSSGQLTRSSSLSIGQLSVPGLSIDVPATTPGTVPLPNPVPGLPQVPPVTLPTVPVPFGGQRLPVPDIGFEDRSFTVTLPGFGTQRFAIPAAVALDALKAAGIETSYQPATRTPTGIRGASFTFTYTVPSLPDNQYFSGTTPVTYTLGAVVANVTLRPAGLGGGTPSGGDTTGGSGGLTTGGTSNGTTGMPAVGSTSGGSGVTSAPGLGATGAGSPGTAVAPPQVSTSTDGQGAAPVASRQVGSVGRLLGFDFDTSDIYLVFVLAALAALASMTMLRLVGVRALWSS
jgi:hypothetical protein